MERARAFAFPPGRRRDTAQTEIRRSVAEEVPMLRAKALELIRSLTGMLGKSKARPLTDSEGGGGDEGEGVGVGEGEGEGVGEGVGWQSRAP